MEMTVIIIRAMYGFPRKGVVLILSLLMALVPLQGLFALEKSMPASHMAKSSALQTQAMPDQYMLDLSNHCADCVKETNCCGDDSCSSHQCAACVVPAFLPVCFLFQAP